MEKEVQEKEKKSSSKEKEEKNAKVKKTENIEEKNSKSKITEEVNSNDKQPKKLKKKIETRKLVIIIVAIASILIISVIGIFILSHRNWDAAKLMRKLKSEMSSSITNYTIYTKDTDVNHLLGDSNEYTSKVSWNDKRIVLNENEDYAGTIEVFRNSKDAQMRKWYYEEVKKQCKNYFKEEIYGRLAEEICADEQYSYLNGNVYVRFSSSFTKGQIEDYEEKLESIFSNYKQTNKKVSSEKQLENIKKQKQSKIKEEYGTKVSTFNEKLDLLAKELENDMEELLNSVDEKKYTEVKADYEELKNLAYYKEKVPSWEAKIKEIENKIIEKKEGYASTITTKLTEISSSLDAEALKQLEEEINGIKDTYYDNHKINWNQTITSIKTNIEAKKESDYKNSCQTYNYQEISRYPEQYSQKRARFFGKVVQVIPSSYSKILRVNVSCEKYKYISGYSCSDTVYVTYYGDTRVLENDMINMWGVLTGTKTYTTVIGNALTIPAFTAEYITIQ